jgi:uncharacterized protein YbjT (DUF2867 family)
VARALILGCGCRGRELGRELLAEGWAVRGTTRHEERLAAIGTAGIEPALADLDRVGTVLELVADVAVVYLLLGSTEGDPEAVAALHGPRLERLMEKLVDTPVRGVVYEATGSVDPALLADGVEIVEAAGRTWRIPVATVTVAPTDPGEWSRELAATGMALLAKPGQAKV